MGSTVAIGVSVSLGSVGPKFICDVAQRGLALRLLDRLRLLRQSFFLSVQPWRGNQRATGRRP
jgi:hypothetical protein